MPGGPISPDERAFFEVFTNRDLLREIAKYNARSVGDFIIMGRKCPFGPTFGLELLDINFELIRAVHHNSPVYFEWLMNKLLEPHEYGQVGLTTALASNIIEIIAQNFTREIVAIMMKNAQLNKYFAEIVLFYLSKYPKFIKLYIEGVFDGIFGADEQVYIHRRLQQYYGHDEAVFEYLVKLRLLPTQISDKNITLKHFKRLVMTGATIDPHAKNNIARDGKLDILEWLHFHDHSSCGVAWLRGAILKNDIKLVQYVLDTCKIHETYNIGALIERNTNLEIVKLLATQSKASTSLMMDYASIIGRIDIIEWINDIGHEISERVVEDLMSSTSVADFKKIVTRIKIDKPMSVPWKLFRDGKIEMLKYLQEIGYLDLKTINPKWVVMFSGHLDIFKWVYGTNGITKRMTTFAACHGNYRILRWICETYKKEIPKQAFRAAIRAENIEMIEWILQHQPCPLNILSYVAKRQSYLLFHWFYERVKPDIEDLKLCMKNLTKMDILWLIYQNHGLTIDSETAKNYIKFRPYDESWKARRMLARS